MRAAADEMAKLEALSGDLTARVFDLEKLLLVATAKPLTGPGSGTTKFGQRPPAAPAIPSTTTKESWP